MATRSDKPLKYNSINDIKKAQNKHKASEKERIKKGTSGVRKQIKKNKPKK